MTSRLSSGLAALIIVLTARAVHAQSAVPVPATAEEALRDLHRSQAPDSGWAAFGSGSSVYYHFQGQGDGRSIDEEGPVFIWRNANGTSEIESLVGRDKARVPAQFSRPELAAAKATFIKTESLTMAGRRYDTWVYEFRTETPSSNGALLTIHRYWLAGGVPGGVIQKESGMMESGQFLTAAGHSRTWLSGRDVPFIVQGKTFRTTCYQIETDLTGGERLATRTCSDPSMPGAVVRREERLARSGKEVSGLTLNVEEFSARDIGTAPKEAVDPLGCTLASMMLNSSGLDQTRRGDYAGAIATFNAMIGVSPSCAIAFTNRGRAKQEAKDTTGAFADYNRAISLAPRLPDAYRNRALLQNDLGNYKASLADLNTALNIAPEYAQALLERAVVYMHLFEDEKARADYVSLLKMQPQSRDLIERLIEKARQGRKRP